MSAAILVGVILSNEEVGDRGVTFIGRGKLRLISPHCVTSITPDFIILMKKTKGENPKSHHSTQKERRD